MGDQWPGQLTRDGRPPAEASGLAPPAPGGVFLLRSLLERVGCRDPRRRRGGKQGGGGARMQCGM